MTTKPKRLTILDVLDDQALFRSVFYGASWSAWRAFLCALFGLAATEEEAALIQRCTRRATVPTEQTREAFCIVGRRGGKSRLAALVAVFLACFRDHSKVLAPGERGVVMLIASDRRQARILKGYVSGLLQAVPMLAQMIANEAAEGIELTNRIIIEIHTASFRSTRGYTIVGALLDELAFWPTADAADPDTEILNALRPAMATIPGALLIAISSPYARRGELWKAYKDHFGKDGDPILIWQADTRTMNPTMPQVVIDHAYAADEAVVAAEYGAQFRRDVESFIAREVVEACVVPGRVELPPVPGVDYHAFVDPAGGSGRDSITVAVVHREADVTVVDCLREVTPPFSPEQVVTDFVHALKAYRVACVHGDRFAGEWPREPFRKLGVEYRVCEQVKSDLYRDLLPKLNSRTVTLHDVPRLLAQLCGLERRTARGGKGSIDHGPNGHDDVINVVAGAVALATSGRVLRVKDVFFAQDLRGPAEEIDQLMVEENGQLIDLELFSQLRDSRVTDQGWRRG